jgi:hypothetical protein
VEERRSPSKVHLVRGHEGPRWCHSPYGQSEINNLGLGMSEGWKAWHKIDWHMLVAKQVTAGRSGCINARATGEVVAVEQSSNNDKGVVENTFQVLAEIKKQQREAPFKATQMDAPVQYTVLAENPATNPADAHSTQYKEIWPASTAPLSRPSRVSYKELHSSYHTASSCAPRSRRPVRPRFRGRLRRLRQRFRWPRLLGGGGFPRG